MQLPDSILLHECKTSKEPVQGNLQHARQLNEPCDSLAIPQKNEKNENQDLWVSAFRNTNCNAMYLFWESPCRYLTFIWHFEMLMKCNANISILGAMQNANVMQMKCNANKCKKMHNSGSNPILYFM